MNFQKVKLQPGLYFVATPIGTARDITLRALDILASADVIAAEDTRSMKKLLEIHGVALEGRPVLSYHDHSGEGARAKLLAHLEAGRSVAYASEAGTPLIADPGYHLSVAAAEAGHLVTSAPGPSAIITALSLAGLPTDSFFFAGFLPNAKKARQSALEAVRDVPGTLVFYESPKRVAAMVADAAAVLGGARKAAVARELTKKFEEVLRGTLDELTRDLPERTIKGEIVVLIDRQRGEAASEADVEAALKEALETLSVRDASDAVAKAYGINRRKVYQLALKLQKAE
ncbi:16S rRNA (cytidine(1402)-2'-O)-methyltransferase [Shimia marina]|uniref:Ribosomal RNA small subunit methyltransferase I n=1 Tax=Shimia marina TaxID=321267 RepID=A0A0P1EUZ6_9RHOB|nr:16S rRNA (cytidine(1402)-2'-O)-methyltransferase [Shimia marina]CUH54328.1 Ribosomal RNA small subunit methyltransferase I [Shimia marina]SFE00674.1 16S rRNA (cytidine1402-2'-O)-methyltransferase [Shimia marina]